MKDGRDIVRSRNARLNLARREAAKIARLLEPELRPGLADDEKWSALFADIRDAATDVYQGVHEANAYHNALLGHPEPEDGE